MRRAIPIKSLVALSAALAALVLPAAAAATATPAKVASATAAAAQWLRAQQSPASGGIEGGFGSEWAATALAAAGVNAADVSAGGPSLQDFLLGEYGSEEWAGLSRPASDYENAVLITRAAGLDPSRLAAGVNLPASVAGLWSQEFGGFGGSGVNSAAFGIIALAGTPLPSWALQPTVSYLRRNQHNDGGWTYEAATTAGDRAKASEQDTTGSVVAALCTAGVPAYDPDLAEALTYLREQLDDSSGAVEYEWGPNASTNAWVIDGLLACGIDPQSPAWTTSAGKTMIDYLISLQTPDGPDAGSYESLGEASVYSTQDALRALAGGGFAPAPAPRANAGLPTVRPAPAVAAGTPVPHLLAVRLGAGNARLCRVVAPAGAPLTAVLEAARDGATPAGCVASLSLADGHVAILDGLAPEAGEAWLARLDGGAEQLAASQPVEFGATISLRIGPNPANTQGPAGPAGATGPAGTTGQPGHKGARGKRGKRGKPGRLVRNATLVCKTKRGKARRGHASQRSGKTTRRARPSRSRRATKLRCVVQHRRHTRR